jgi:ParB family chromosome partitioning protein
MTKASRNKSIIANFGALNVSVSEAAPGLAAVPAPRVNAGVIGATQRSIAEIREERDRLQAQLASGAGIDIDPKLIDPSPFPDRLPDDGTQEFEAFKNLFEEEGQKVPIQVRRHPNMDGRYQVVYGHRRWRAALEIRRPVKAIVVDLDDTELAVAQGIENAARQDLTWIERALFAARMDEASVRSRDIRAALVIDDPELARLRSVTRVLPRDIVEQIGRAPKVGRPRWLELAMAVGQDKSALARVRSTLSADKVSASSSDQRFQLALGAALRAATGNAEQRQLDLFGADGAPIGKVRFAPTGLNLQVKGESGRNLLAFLETELPALVRRFQQDRGGS